MGSRSVTFRSSGLLRDGAWTLLFNVLTKTQSVGALVAGAIAGGVVDVGRLSAAVAAASLGAGLADFGYSYESGRLVAGSPSQEAARAVIRRFPPRAGSGALLTVLAFYLSIGRRNPDLWLSLEIAVMGGSITCSMISVQVLNALREFRSTATTFGAIRLTSGVVAIGTAWSSRNIDLIVLGLMIAELTSASILTRRLTLIARSLPAVNGEITIGHGHLCLGVGSMINIIISRSDVLLVGALTDPLVLGIYSVASQMENAIESLAQSPSGPLLSYVARARAEGRPVTGYVARSRRATFRLGCLGALSAIALYCIYCTLPLNHGALRLASAGYAIIACLLASIPLAVAGIYMNLMTAVRAYGAIGLVRITNGIIAAAAFATFAPHFGAAGAASAAILRDVSLWILASVVATWILGRCESSDVGAVRKNRHYDIWKNRQYDI